MKRYFLVLFFLFGSAQSSALTGEEVYSQSCIACHAAGAAGAPKFRNENDWAPRIEQGLQTLYDNAINGIGAMPPKGLCPSCTDEEIIAATDYMIEGLVPEATEVSIPFPFGGLVFLAVIFGVIVRYVTVNNITRL